MSQVASDLDRVRGSSLDSNPIVSFYAPLPAIPKQDSIFRITVDRLELTVMGRHLNIRPAERSVKKIKKFMDLDL